MRDEPVVRAAMDSVEHALGLVAVPGNPALVDLRASWRHLVEALALGPAPELRTCPHCGASGMRAATRCGSCWRSLTPPTAAETGAA